MSIRTIKTYTTTGPQDTIDVPHGHNITWAVIPDTGTPVFAVEVQLNEGGAWVTSDSEALNINQAYTFAGGVEAIRLNISDLGGASSVNFEVSGDNR